MALRGAFTRFQPADTVKWFEAHGVKLKTEADNRMFPVTDSSKTIADCLREAAQKCRGEGAAWDESAKGGEKLKGWIQARG